MTLLEVTVVILVLLTLISLLFIAAQSWKRASDRTACIINIQKMQKGVRGYSNMYGFEAGSNAPNLKDQILGFGRYVEATPFCPGGGTYSYGQTSGADTIPPYGDLYLDCSLSGSDGHIPEDFSDW